MLDIIATKRDGGELTATEIEFLIRGYVANEIPDYQVAAFLMAVYIRGLSEAETVALTMAMAKSGDMLDLAEIPGVKVDKHSTGGVGDKTTLVVAPLVAAAGVPVAKISGRGLGHSGGTVDKLESIPGFQAELSATDFIANVRKIDLAISGQTGNLAPADKLIYAVRDATATVASIPLIASSIMSKKIAAGADAVILDVKCGRGAFMPDLPAARVLAQTMINIGRSVGKKTVTVISNMDQPLGAAVGNALEVKEAILTLQNQGPADLSQLVLALGAEMLVVAGRVDSAAEGRQLLEKLLTTRVAWAKFREFVVAQGGDPAAVDNPKLLPQAQFVLPVRSCSDGFIVGLAADKVGRAAAALGAGRQKKGDIVDPAVGIVLKSKLGDKIQTGRLLAEVHANDLLKAEGAVEELISAYEVGPGPAPPKPLIFQVLP